VRISRQTSGGRGEYEISEISPEGLSPRDLFGRRLVLDFGHGWLVDTGTVLTGQGGKRRIRLSNAEIHLHRQVAAASLMPHPVRAEKILGRGVPILKANRYAIEHIELGGVKRIGNDVAQLLIHEIILRNISHHAEQLGFGDRLRKIEHIWTSRKELPDSITALLAKHRTLVRSGQPIPAEAETLISAMQRILTENSSDFGIVYRSEDEDILPDLLRALDSARVPPEPPIAVADVDPDDTEIRRRTIKEWKRWANSRGAASARFRQAVRAAWNSTCAVCGMHLPATANSISGVDAAHILPWAEFDLDHASNGICLCRHHHWAFDEGLIVIREDRGRYYVDIPEEVAASIRQEKPQFSLESLLECAGQIPDGRLPRDARARPRPGFLKMLRQSY